MDAFIFRFETHAKSMKWEEEHWVTYIVTYMTRKALYILSVKKTDGSNIFCIDFRAINQHTIFDSEPVPNPEDIFNKLGKFIFFTKVDLSKGYWLIPLDDLSRPYTAFQVPQGLFQFRVLAFGLSTACATFARMMRLLLQGLKFTVNFFDDSLIFSMTWQEHLSHLKLFLNACDKSILLPVLQRFPFDLLPLNFLTILSEKIVFALEIRRLIKLR